MTTDEEWTYAVLTTRIEERMRRESPFACFRLPSEENYITEIGVQQIARVVQISAEQLRGRRGVSGYLIAPFATTSDTPMLLIEDEDGARRIKITRYEEALPAKPSVIAPIPQELPEAYRTAFEHFTERLQEGDAEKLVLAHRIELPSIPTELVIGAFCRALTHFPRAFVSLFYTPQTGLWLSATPEMLLIGEDKEWQTVALAGTMPRQSDDSLSVWSEKNRREHQYVRNFIAELLENEGIPHTALPVESIPSGALQHLKARFVLQLPKGYAPLTLAEKLHPTPAICGTPQQVAQQIIQKEELIDRTYYAGYVGWYEPERRVDLFVHIRCLQLLPNKVLRLHAGGGIVRGSKLESEWQEVLHKMSAIYDLI